MPDSFVEEDSFTPEDEEFSVGGVVKALPRAGKDLLEGFGSGVARTVTGARDLLNKGTKAVGVGEIPDVPRGLREAGQDTQNGGESSFGFKAGRGIETAAEFMAPGGLVTKGADAAGLAAAKLAGSAGLARGVARVGGRVAGDVASTAGIAGVHSGGDQAEVAKAAITAGIVSGGLSTVGGLLEAIPSSAIWLKGLRLPERFGGDRAEEIVDKAIADKILISRGGSNKAEAFANLSRAARDAEISKHANELVDFNIIREPALKLRKMVSLLGEKGIVKQIDKRLADFEEARGAAPAVPGTAAKTITSPIVGPKGQAITSTVPGTPGTPAKPPQITVAEAQKAKDDFNLLAENFFGKFSTGAGQIRKLLGAGLKEGIENISPEVKQLNRDTQNSMIIKKAIDKYLDSNQDLLNPRTAVLAIWNTPAALVYGALQSPYVRSALAIAKDRSTITAPAIQAVPRLAGGAVEGTSPLPQGPQ